MAKVEIVQAQCIRLQNLLDDFLRFARGRGASTSELTTRLEHDPLMGSPGYNVNFVRLERASGSANAGSHGGEA